MKKQLTIIALFLIYFSGSAKAQYFSFLKDSTTKWVVNFFDSTRTCSPCSAIKYELTADTVSLKVNSVMQTYRVINSLDGFGNKDVFYVREASKQVYLLNNNGTEMLLYNFNLTPGEVVTGYLASGCNNNPIVVDNLDSVKIGSGNRARINFHGPCVTGSFIEGVGSNLGLFSKLYQADEYSKLFCYSVGGDRLYPHSAPGSCELISGLRETLKDEDKVTIQPNPIVSTGKILIPASLKEGELIIYNLMGVVKSQIKVKGGETIELSASDFQSGTYFYKLFSKSGQLTGRFLVNGH